MAFNRQRLEEVAKPRNDQEIKSAILRKVKRTIHREGWLGITDQFIDGWFNYYYDKLGDNYLDIVAKIIDEFDSATNIYDGKE